MKSASGTTFTYWLNEEDQETALEESDGLNFTVSL